MDNLKPRNLKLAVIDDDPKDLAGIFENVDPVFFPDYGGAIETQCITTWAQSLEIHASRKRRKVDLLCIDAKFHNDTTDLPYCGELSGNQVDVTKPNPMGLLIGMSFVSRYMGRSKPFGFVVYSGDASSVSNDSIAVNCMGILEAIAGNRFSQDGAQRADVRDVVKSLLHSLPASSPAGRRSELMTMYRKNFKQVVGRAGRVDVENNIAPLLELCEHKKFNELKNQGLKLFINDRVDNIRIGSIFADTPKMRASDVVAFIQPFLLELINIDNSCENDLFPCTVDAMGALDHQFRRENGDAKDFSLLHVLEGVTGFKSTRPPRHDIAYSCVICMFLELLKKKQAMHIGLRDRILGRLFTDQKSLDRELKQVDASISLGRFLSQMSSNKLKLDERFRMCGCMYALQIAGFQNEDLPAFLKRGRT